MKTKKLLSMKNFIRAIPLTFIVAFLSTSVMTLPGATLTERQFLVQTETFILDTITIYNPVQSQCDADPLVTASNQRIDADLLQSGTIRWMALSRDMLRRWGGAVNFGDTLELISGDTTINGRWIVQDTMNKRFRRRGDLLFHTDTRSKGRWTQVTARRRKYYFLEND